MFEIYDQKTGRIKDQRQTVSDLIVYQSPRDPNSMTEYRNIREVDGKPVKKQLERVEKLFERATKADSVARELDRKYEKLNVTGPLMRGTSEYDPFRRFEVGARHENVPNKDDK